jgi:phage I-like protein
MRRYGVITLSIDAVGNEPTEFRIFKAGVNQTSKGPVLFDDAAAESVMAAYHAQGIDLMIDLEHHSLDTPIRPDSADARGWFQLALRNGELWAVNVQWTPDGLRRLTEKTQRYISPAFVRGEADRVTEIYNAGLCAVPATHAAQPLVAASKTFTASQRARAYRLLEKLNGS